MTLYLPAVGATCHAAWTKVFEMRLCLEWFRLEERRDPATLEFTTPFAQATWNDFVRRYRRASHSGNQHDQAPLLGIWLQSEVQDLRTLRSRLP